MPWRLLVSSAVLLAAVGCAAEGVVEQAGPAPESPEVLELRPGGFGPVDIGFLADDAEEALAGAGLQKVSDESSDYCRFQRYDSDRTGPFELWYDAEGVLFLIGAGQWFGPETHNSGIRTAEGVQIGDGERRLQELYPRLRPTPEDGLGSSEPTGYLLDEAGDAVSMVVDEGVVTTLATAQRSTFDQEGFCS